jgi:hypothetical protein
MEDFAMSEILQSHAESLGLTMSDDTTMDGTIKGVTCTCVYRAAHRHGPESFTVTLPVRIRSEFTVRKEKRSDRFFKKIGLASELSTGDAIFDRNYYIETYHDKFAAMYFRDASKRSTVEALFALRPEVSTVALKEGAVVITITPCPPESLSVEQISSLVTLGAEIGQTSEVVMEERENRGKMVDNFLIGFTVVLALVGFSALCAGMIIYETDDMSLAGHGVLWGCGAFGVFLVAAFLAIRGRSSSPRVFTIVFFSGLFGFPSMGGAVPLIVNGWCDSSPAVEYILPVTGTSKTTGKSTTYYVHTVHWRIGEEVTQISVHGDTYRRIREGDLVHVYVKPGALGYEWIESVAIADVPGIDGK